MTTRDFLKRYAYLYLYVVCAFLVAAAMVRTAAEAVSSEQSLTLRPNIVIDAGHGGIDGGTTSCTGVLESTINLDIALRLEKVMALLGYDTVMTRSTPDSIATEGQTIRQQKQSDLRNRVAIVNDQSNTILVSIHQNFYPDSRYWGPQVFYAQTEQSQTLAGKMQTNLSRVLNPSVKRTCKAADGVYLMKNIQTTGILIECGFLSNPTEEALLRSDGYQNKLCAIIGAGLAEYIETAMVS